MATASEAGVFATDDPRETLDVAGDFLLTRPVEHNVILTLLHQRIEHAEPGCYWWIVDDSDVAGVAFHSPSTFSAAITPMPAGLAARLADAIEPPLPGVIAEAATAAAFAGAWAQRHGVPVAPVAAARLYHLPAVRSVARAGGALRAARPEERAVLVAWADAFSRETDPGSGAAEEAVDRFLDEQSLWLWEDGDGAVSMARATPVVGGVVRIGLVFTPPEVRGRGYATACVEHVSRSIEDAGHTAILYTQLSNPISNAIYERIGYEPVLEVLQYSFDSR